MLLSESDKVRIEKEENIVARSRYPLIKGLCLPTIFVQANNLHREPPCDICCPVVRSIIDDDHFIDSRASDKRL
jgi:hypothetical protein